MENGIEDRRGSIATERLEKDRNLRYQHASEVRAELQRLKRDSELSRMAPSIDRSVDSGVGRRLPPGQRPHSPGKPQSPITAMTPTSVAEATKLKSSWFQCWRKWLIWIAVVTSMVFAIFLLRAHVTPKLTDKDTIVLADFENKTGDAVFDDTLKQALTVDLEQSPFLNILSGQKVSDTLKLMGRSPRERLTADVAREICERVGSRAVVGAWIASLGSHYVVGVNGTDCVTGDSLAREETEATSKENVLKALDHATTTLRKKLGESLQSVRKFNTPVDEATTRSLEALQAFSLGREVLRNGQHAAAVALFQKAIRLDPTFAAAYAALGLTLRSLGETKLAAENTRKAYELRQGVSEPERLFLECQYHEVVTGNLEKARQAYELWEQTYPRNPTPPNNLGGIYSHLGQYDDSEAIIHRDIKPANIFVTKRWARQGSGFRVGEDTQSQARASGRQCGDGGQRGAPDQLRRYAGHNCVYVAGAGAGQRTRCTY